MILCICDYGEVRSVAMRNVLRRRGYCAEAIGVYSCELGDEILKYKPKHIIWMCTESHSTQGFIGKDIWGNHKNKKLIKLCEQKADELGFIDKRKIK